MADLIYNVTGQTLTLDTWDRPASVTSLEVWPMSGGDGDTVETAFGSPSIEANPSTTFDANSGDGQSDPNVLNLTSTTGIAVGRRYLATNANSESEWVEVIDVISGASARARHPLRNAYVSGDSFESTRITATVDATWVADSNNITDDFDPNPGYRARWTYVDAGSTTRVVDTYFDLVRYQGQHTVRPIDVDVLVPGWMDSLPPEHREDRGARLIDEAYSEVKLDLHEFSLPDEMIRNREILNALVIRKAVQLAEEAKVILGSGTVEGLDLSQQRYQGRLDKLLKVTSKVTVATGSGGGGGRTTAEGFWGK